MRCPHCQNEIEVRINKAPQQHADREGFGDTSASGDIGGLLVRSLVQPMTDWEEKFITDLQGRYDKYKERTKVSDKQMSVLRKIANGEGGRSREDEF